MANNLGTNPMVVDSVMAAPFKTPVKVSSIIWADPVAINDVLVILDSKGNKVAQATCTAAKLPVSIQLIDTWFPNGFQVTTLSSGVVYVYLD